MGGRNYRLAHLLLLICLALAACAAGEEGGLPLLSGEAGAGEEPPAEVEAEREEEVDLQAVESAASERPVIVGALGAENVDVLVSYLSTGYDIYNGEGEEIGEVEDFLIHIPTGAVLYLLVEHGGYMGIGDTDIPIPLSALAWHGEEQLVLQAPVEYLEGLSDVPNDWPQGEGEDWDEQIRSFWAELGVELIPEAGDVEEVQRYSELFTTAAPGEESGGVIADLVIDLTHGRVKYVLLDFGEQVLRVVPWGAVAAVTEFLVFDPDLDAEQLIAAPRVPTDLPALHTEAAWDDEIATFWAEAGFPIEESEED